MHLHVRTMLSCSLPELLRFEVASSSVGIAHRQASINLKGLSVGIDGRPVVARSVHGITFVLQEHWLPL